MVVRENPLPVGRYWLDLIGDSKRVSFEGGVKGLNEAHPGLVHVISTAHHNAGEDGNEQPRDWVLFATTAPAIWDFEAIGTPTVAAPSVMSEGDTVQRPPPEPGAAEQIADALAAAKRAALSTTQAVQTVAYVFVGAVLLAGVIIAVTRFGGKPART